MFEYCVGLKLGQTVEYLLRLIPNGLSEPTSLAIIIGQDDLCGLDPEARCEMSIGRSFIAAPAYKCIVGPYLPNTILRIANRMQDL